MAVFMRRFFLHVLWGVRDYVSWMLRTDAASSKKRG
jgi:hypothetical protein